MKRIQVTTSLIVVLAMLLCTMATGFAVTTDQEYYRCNGTNAGSYIQSSHSYGSNNCNIMIRQSYCTLYRNGVSQGTQFHTHDHVRYHTQSGCPGGTTTVCTHGSNH